MKLDKIYIMIMLLLLLFCIGNVAANENNDVDSVLVIDNSSIDIAADNELISLSGSEETPILEDSNEIEVESWDDLKYYCSLKDKNYNLKLKENTNYYPTDPTSDDYQIIINNNVTISGSSGAYIGDSSPDARGIEYLPIKVNDKSGVGITLQNITFKWINTDYQTDGVFLVMGGDVNNTIKDCYFYNITTNNGHSSILQIKYGDLEVVNCTFMNCTTDFGCISVYCPEDVATGLCTRARMVVRDSYFEGNYARTEPGCINNCGVLRVYNTTFYKNSAFWWAGAIHTHGGGNTSLYESTFIDNVAGWNGGALYTYSYLQIYNSTFIGNNCTTNNGGGAIGACKYLHSPYVYIVGTLFKDNSNNCWGLDDLSTNGTGRGGAISIMDEGAIEVLNSTFIHNSASKGSAIAIISGANYGDPDVTLIGNKFINNTKIGDVLYIYVTSASNVVIHDNYFENSTIEFSKFRIASQDPVGDSITINIDASLLNPSAYDEDILDKIKYDVYVDGVFYRTIIGKEFVYHFEDDEKHEVYITSPISGDVSNEISVSNNKEYIFVSKKSGNDGNDGLSNATPVATLSKAIALAGATGNIYIMDGTFTESNLNIGYDLTIAGEDNVKISGTSGNLFNSSGTSLTIKNIQFLNLKQTDSTTRIIRASDLLTLENCKFVGGTYYNAIEAKEIRMYNTVFDGISVKSSIIDAKILSADNVSCTNNNFNGNSGGLFISKSANVWNIMNSNFINNVNLKDGCIYLKGTSTSEIKFYNVTFDSNSIDKSGAAAYSSCIRIDSDMNVNIDYSTFINNDNSYYSKAAIINSGSSTLSVSNSIILNNTHGSSATIFYASSSNRAKITADNNWFGNSLDKIDVKPDLFDKIKCNFWYSLNASSSLDKLGPGEKATITIDLNYLVSKDGRVFYSTFKNKNAITFALSAINGQLSSNEVTLKDGFAQVEFTKTGYEDAYINIYYIGGNSSLKINGSKNTPQLSIETSNITAGDDLTVTVNLSSDATGECTLTFNNTNYALIFENGVAAKTFTSLPAGNYPITVTFNGDLKYLPKTVTDYVTSTKLDSFINVNAEDFIYVDENLIVSVNVNSDATGNITVNIGDKILIQEVNNGAAVFNISKIASGNYTLVTTYSGNIRYCEASDSRNVVVSKYDSSTSISADLNDLEPGNDVTFIINVLSDATGNVTINHNGDLTNIAIEDGKAVYTLNGITKGDHTVTAIYSGDSKYLPSEDSVILSVAKLNSTVTVAVENISYNQNATVVVSLISGATGNVTVNVDNKTYVGKITNNQAIITISGLSAGSKELTVYYDGDDNYLPSSNVTAFNVAKINPSFAVTANSVMVGDEAVIRITFADDMTGSFRISLDGQNVTRTIIRGTVSDWKVANLNPGNYTVYVSYSGDNNYYSIDNETDFKVTEYPVPQLANEGIDKNNDKSPFEGLSNGEIIFEISLDDKINGSIVIDNAGNIYFASKTNLFAYNKNGELIWKYLGDELGYSTLSGVTIGRNVVISPMEGNRLYFVNMTSGEKYGSSNLYQGSSLFSPIIDENYNIYITSEYQYDDSDYKLVIIPYNLWKIGGKPSMISIGNSKPISSPLLIDSNTAAVATESGLKIIDLETKSIVYTGNIKLSHPIAGQGGTVYALSDDSIVSLIGGVQQWKTEVTDGVGSCLALDSDLGYLYSVNSNGILYKYDIGSGEELLVYDFKEKSSSNILIDNNGVIYLGLKNGMFYSLDDAGNLFWKVNLTGEITGNPVIDEEGFIYVIANGSKVVKLGNGALKDPNIDVNVNNITYGENLTVELTFDCEITGEITISVDDNVYTTIIPENSSSTISIPNLGTGNHVINVAYSGDMRFIQYDSNISCGVSKQDAKVGIVSCGNISVGDMAFIDIILPQGASGNVTVSINGQNSTFDINETVIRVDLNSSRAGNYVVKIKYNGDNNFNSCENATEFYISKIKTYASNLTVTASKCSVNLPDDAGGRLVVTVDNVEYGTADVVNGAATISISGLASGSHEITLYYQGDNKYHAVSKSATVNVPVVKLTGSDLSMLYTSNGKYKVRLTSDGVGLSGKTITFTINGKKTTATTDSKGYAQVTIKLAPKSGKYAVSAAYGNLKVKNMVKVKTIMSAKNMKVKKSAKTLKIKVTLKKVNGKYLKSKRVILKFNKKTYKAKTNAKGVATFKITKKVIKKLKAGKKYTYKATYLKDSIKKVVTVKK